MNVLGYIVYLSITFFITVHTGYQFYKNGRIFILTETQHNIHLTDAINKLLLVGYYLLNLGYSAMTLYGWKPILDIQNLIGVLSIKIGTILFILASIHYFNMLLLHFFLSKKTFHTL
jgi:amino acid transporter